ncbi:MAG: HlyD family efflux transporter periplasmic adaptor subunit [Wenzhouxiangellaceae bacterium]|nr:HlyD family efflux transporter periplasmic adaptor subunit [Wenzhouxiangellaceae bacterium]MBS3746415.1 HlyD family efflux transporter periplasmic adaptor subunit [Wenzhouxiangellaceae bacterium]MBS3823148.1 HlyD family efflux transporter periplasmic adaptor subunit [Wenzhouxiangellaceae bacterium]
MSDQNDAPAASRPGSRAFLARMIGFALMGGALVAIILAVAVHRTNPRTDHATVGATIVPVSTNVPGHVAEIFINNNAFVEAGDLLFRIDPEPYELRVEQARAMLRTAEAELETGGRLLATQQTNAEIAARQVDRARNHVDLTRQTLGRLENLLPKGMVTAQQVDDARTIHEDALISLDEALSQQQAAQTMVGTLDARTAQVDLARVSLALAERELRQTEVRAPITGRITGLDLGIGTYVVTGVAKFSLIDTEDWRATALFRETELRRVRVGAPVDVFVMSAPGRRLRGHVESLGYGVRTTDEISILGLPVIDSSVDWVRVAQRFPVIIRLEDPPEELMRVGASASVVIHSADD